MKYKATYSDENLMDVYDANDDYDAFKEADSMADRYGGGVFVFNIEEIDDNYDHVRTVY